MQTLRTLVVALMALAWVTVTSHCQFEALPGLEFLRCATELQVPDEGGDPCNEGGCCSVESAKYQSPRQQEMLPVVLVAILPVDDFDMLELSLPVGVSFGILTAAPPELQASWQFSLRTALPVRAPSLNS
ncbi:MAG: hypothetical protein O2960_04065 [Verrucomicrobia bacterium]|nr:hypothetical protein [Verrucomicrobiota bacterium]